LKDTLWKTIAKTIVAVRKVEEQFAKIQENPALHSAENSLTDEGQTILDQLITLCGAANIAGKEIGRRALAKSKKTKGDDKEKKQ
jgi:hypothetical protein